METHPHPILIVEDSDVSRTMMVLLFEKAGYEVVSHSDGDEALADINARKFSMLILDQQLPGKSGVELLEADRKYNRNTPAVFVAGNLSLEDAVKISHLGIAGIFTKPADPVALLRKAEEITRKSDLTKSSGSDLDLEPVTQTTTDPKKESRVAAPVEGRVAYPTNHFPAAAPAFIELTHRLWKVRNFKSTLLLMGSPGTLYDEILRDMHAASDWSEGPIRVYPNRELDSDTLLDLLAHSLVEKKPTTIVIRSMHELDSEGQACLNQFLAFDGVFMPFAQRVRVVLTSDSDLNDELEDGSLDETLHFRASSISAKIPSLSEVKEDIPSLARHFLEKNSRTGDYKHSLQLTKEAAAWMKQRDWTGNFEALRYFIAITVHFATSREITSELLTNVTQLIDANSAPTREELAAEVASIQSAKTQQIEPPPLAPEAIAPVEADTDDSEDNPEEISSDPEASDPVPRQGVASYLPEALTSDEIEKAISGSSSSATQKKPVSTGKRLIQRKKPGSYDFASRLSSILPDDPSTK